jgi:hypothetical protein
MAALPTPRSCERRRTFPSIAMTCPLITVLTALIQRIKLSWNCSGSIRANTRLNVSCEGIPLGKSKNVSNHSTFACPNSATSSQLSAPAIIAHNAITRISSNLCNLVRSMRGSVMSPKCRSMDAVASSMAYLQIWFWNRRISQVAPACPDRFRCVHPKFPSVP